MLKLEAGDFSLRIWPNPGLGIPIDSRRRLVVSFQKIREHGGAETRPIVRIRPRTAVSKGRPHEGDCVPACRHR